VIARLQPTSSIANIKVSETKMHGGNVAATERLHKANLQQAARSTRPTTCVAIKCALDTVLSLLGKPEIYHNGLHANP
jgi:hypothetical protein